MRLRLLQGLSLPQAPGPGKPFGPSASSEVHTGDVGAGRLHCHPACPEPIYSPVSHGRRRVDRSAVEGGLHLGGRSVTAPAAPVLWYPPSSCSEGPGPSRTSWHLGPQPQPQGQDSTTPPSPLAQAAERHLRHKPLSFPSFSPSALRQV